MNLDSDEDVIFENSVLHQHLKSMGVDNIETEPQRRNTGDLQKESPTETKKEKIQGTDIKRLNWFSFLRLRTILRHLDSVAKDKIYVKLRQCKTLEPDDEHFLQEFLGPYPSSDERLLRFSFGLVSAAVVMVSCLIQRIIFTSLSWYRVFFSDPVVILGTCCVMLLIGCLLFLFVKQKKLEEQILCFDEFLKSIQNFQSMLKKSVRLIQECELVARGFTMVANSGPLSGLEQRSSQKSARQCPELRHQLFHVSRDCMMYLRNATQILVQRFYPASLGEGTSHYVAFIPLEDYGPCIQIRGNSAESLAQLVEATDNFSIAALKAISNLWTLQQSEFIRCLAVCFQSLKQWPSNKAQEVSIQRILKQVLQPPATTTEECLKSLSRCYDFYQASIFEETLQQVDIDRKDTPLKGFYIAIHSLDLHLQSALKSSRALAAEIQNNMENQKERISDDVSNQLMAQLERIRVELAACQDCWAEGQGQGERLFRKGREAMPSEVTPNTTSVPTQPTKPVMQIIGEPVIEDEVFEAYVDLEDEDLQTSTWDEFLSPEEKAKKKKEKEEALRLLSELKTVISGLAEERRKKEDKILRTKMGGDYVQGELSEKNMSSAIQEGRESGAVNGSPILSNSLLTEMGSSAGVSVSNLPEGKFQRMEINSHRGDPDDVVVKGGQGLVSGGNDLSHGGGIPDRDAGTNDRLDSGRKARPVTGNEQQTNANLDGPERPSLHDFSGSSQTRGEEVAERLQRVSGANLSFTASLAAQAVARSRLLGLESETFGDDDDDNDDGSDCNDDISHDDKNDEFGWKNTDTL